MSRRRRSVAARRALSFILLALLVGALATVQPAPVGSRVAADPARAEDAAGGSAVTARGRNLGPDDVVPGTAPADFSALEVTVSQTKDLVNQAVVVTWEGATPTPRQRQLGVDYLQVMQCWGDPEAADDPLGLRFRETCQFGTKLGAPAMPNQNIGDLTSINAGTREIQVEVAGYPPRDPGETLPEGARMVPFWPVSCQPVRPDCGQPRTPDGSPANPLPTIRDPKTGGQREAYPEETLARHFTSAVTNEYPYALTSGDGTGRIAFEVQNATRAPDLGCGASYQDSAGREQPSRPCWLVIVPRGHVHPYTGADVSVVGGVHGSPLTPALWQHRIVVPLGFEPIGDVCPLDRAERITAGTELVAEAATSWRPALCTAAGGPSVSYSPVGDFDAARQVLAPMETAPGLVYSAEPVPTTDADPALVHAPVTLSGVVIAINIDVNLDPLTRHDPEIEKLRGLGLDDVKLTPRLVAKLLTQSYRRDVPGNGGPPQNPGSLRDDPEFLDLNPVFRSWDIRPGFTLQGLMMPNGSSVAARTLWRWVLADPVAAAWLRGTTDNPAPDEHGMVLNPEYEEVIRGGEPDYFPKVDPTCMSQTYEDRSGNDAEARLCTLDYRPYTGGLGKGAEQTLRADSTGRAYPLDLVNIPVSGVPEFTRVPRDQLGVRFAMSVTDSASAARYGLFTAQLCRATYHTAEDRYAASDCRAASTEGMRTAAESLAPSEVRDAPVIDPARAWSTPGAYPLSVLTYAVADTTDPADARRDYATLLRYIAGPGQQPGFARGQLPEGYVALSDALRARARAAADQLERARPPASPTPGATTAPPVANPPPAVIPPQPAATTGAAPLPVGVPSPGAVPSPGNTAPSPPPSTDLAVRASQGSPLGTIRYLLAGILAIGLIGGVAGPILRRYGVRYLPTETDE
ncbi:hypothetical protein [Micromonospora sp. WMMD1082]|uniref:hypothetical protein n=1 Tax=Micromonospora sp. WMMD1082 TaxID=3016104 RepID=UPI0024170A8D|nr:hypothetical protein [Micromonospora sp. WMMD1082]MDG4795281.1 hypothetical protein [Micromonospora sp. WMMD1082]